MADQQNDTALEARLEALRQPPENPDLDFHAILLTGTADGGMTVGYLCTRWLGFQDDQCRIELRQCTSVKACYAEGLDEIGIPCLFILNDEALMLFLMAGGAALVERDIAESYFAELTEPLVSYPFGRSGFVDEQVLEEGSLRRAPTPKKRMAILTRDRRRCRICGRRPDDQVDIELDVHHIRPWENGGVTDSSNLITLCHTCHKGLDPHFDPSLFEQVEQRDSLSFLRDFSRGVADYRRIDPLRFSI